MEELLSAIVAAIVLGSIFVCITVIVYHKISCTNRLRMRKIEATVPRIVMVNDVDVANAINEVLPKLDEEAVSGSAIDGIREALRRIGGR